MSQKDFSARALPGRDVRPALREELKKVLDTCTGCDLCRKECGFLRKHGKPKDIADSYDPATENDLAMPFECSLCQLCAAVCPVKINPADMFLEMRREATFRGAGENPKHAVLLGYEARGTSQRYTYYKLPEGCDTIFFPGCALPGARPDKVIRLYEHLKPYIPSLGVVLDCCTKPSHDLGRDGYMTAMFEEMKKYLQNRGVKTVLVACPNCHKVFSRYGFPLSVRTVYEVMAEHSLPEAPQANGTVTVHDPCAVRFEEKIHAAVRQLIEAKGLSIEEMPHTKTKTLCCGEGGAVGFLSPELSERWGRLRMQEVNDRRIVTYCAGCANYLNRLTPTSHILDLLFEPETTLTGKARMSTGPITYWNRLWLKAGLRKTGDGAVTRERAYAGGAKSGKGSLTRIPFLSFITGLGRRGTRPHRDNP